MFSIGTYFSTSAPKRGNAVLLAIYTACNLFKDAFSNSRIEMDVRGKDGSLI